MRTTGRDDVEQGPRGRGHGCHGGSGCCGGHGHGRRREYEDEPASLRATLEERRRDLEQELADIAEQLGDRRPDRPGRS